VARTGCCTTARVEGGRVERLERHSARLRRDALRLGLPSPEARAIEALALATAQEAFAHGDGVLRLEWSAEAGAAPRLSATTRPLGAEPPVWRAVTARVVHPGPGKRQGAKAIGVAAWDAAHDEQRRAEVDEALLYDAQGRLVEGGRTNLIVVAADGRAWTPALRLGAVEGLGLGIVRASDAGRSIAESDALDREAVAAAREVVAVNAVRGAVAIVEVDARPIADGRSGPLARRLRAPFARVAP